ncbi:MULTISPECIES: SDR family oxidoreductase [unclassified Sedimentibacter]|uniref:SDR family oxidoreductase n=1 Tax=unclassified Sedimentibacter TaxID=2649220 RepID=UPI0027DECD02|nr:SDR family oxidoreductase [Sedimentibacter sp. MB35-C1]WMJ76168.1 SDR family oxidoreductase [Sedimentibacter sp. MB35-C1]
MKTDLMYTTQDIKGQTQTEPGKESEMNPRPIYDDVNCRGYGRLKGKVAIITGGDSGIGRAVAVAYAKEGCNVAIVYNIADDDANETKMAVESYGGTAYLIKGNLRDSNFCNEAVEKTISQFGSLDILVNNAAIQHPQTNFEDITDEQLDDTFRTNIYSMFYLTRSALKYLKEGSSIINTSSVVAFRGSKDLIDYSAAKGAVTSFTRSLSQNLAGRNIRVNQVAPGPIWTPLIPSTFDKSKVGVFGKDTPMKRPGQPAELAEAYVYLATDCSSYMTGQTMHINGGDIVNS